MAADAADAASAESIVEFVSAGRGRNERVASRALSGRPSPVLRHPREMRCVRRGEGRVAKHGKPCSLPMKVARRSRHYSVEARYAFAIALWSCPCRRTSQPRGLPHEAWIDFYFLPLLFCSLTKRSPVS